MYTGNITFHLLGYTGLLHTIKSCPADLLCNESNLHLLFQGITIQLKVTNQLLTFLASYENYVSDTSAMRYVLC